MKVTTQTLENCQVEMTIEIEDEQIQPALRQVAHRLGQKVNVPGFRKGKAPYAILVQRLGEDALYDEMFHEMGTEWIEQAFQEADIVPFRQPEMRDMQLKPFSFKLVVPTKPVVDLGDYRNLRVPFELPSVGDEDVDNTLEQLRQRNAMMEPAGDGPAEWGQVATVYIQAQDSNGKHWDFSAVTDEGGLLSLVLDEETTFPLPGFVAQVVGMTVGEKKSFNLTVPDDFETEDMRGAGVTFEVRLEELKLRSVPALDDALAQTIGSFETIDQLREVVRRSMEQQVRAKTTEAYTYMCLDRLIQSSQIDFPPTLVEDQLDRQLEDLKANLKKKKMSLEHYLNVNKQTEAEYREQMRPIATTLVRQGLVLGRFIELEGLDSEDAQVWNKAIARLTVICKGETPADAAGEASVEANDLAEVLPGDVEKLIQEAA